MKILIADKFSEAHLDRLNKVGCEVTYNPVVKADELPKLIAPYRILVVRSKQVTADTLRASEQLLLVLRAGAGVNTIDVKAASARGIYVSNCPGKNSIAVAELVFALLLAIDRRIADNTAALRAHKWNKKEFSKADGIYDKTLGVIGVGRIGREVITRAQAFGLRVIAWSRTLTPGKAEELGVECGGIRRRMLRQRGRRFPSRRHRDIAPRAEARDAQIRQCRPPRAHETQRDPHQHRARRSR